MGVPGAIYGLCGDLRRDQEELRGFTFLGCSWPKAQELRRELLTAIKRRR